MPYDDYPDEYGLRYPVALLYSLVVALFWIPAFVIRRAGRFAREIGIENWPRANGYVTGGNVKVVHGWVVDYALGLMDYSYRVGGAYFAGHITRQYADEQSAWEFVDAHRDRPVVVRYKDDKAQASALRAEDQGYSWTEASGGGLLEMVRQHWRDELRGEEEEMPEEQLQRNKNSTTEIRAAKERPLHNP